MLDAVALFVVDLQQNPRDSTDGVIGLTWAGLDGTIYGAVRIGCPV